MTSTPSLRPPALPSPTRAPRQIERISEALSRPRAMGLALGGLIAIVYGLRVGLRQSEVLFRPSLFLVHFLITLGWVVVTLGLADGLCLLALRRSLMRDHKETIRQLEGDPGTFEPKLSAGLPWRAIGRALGPKSRSAGSAGPFGFELARSFAITRIGTGVLSFAIATGPLLGLLGTIVGLRSTFTDPNVIVNGSMQIAKVMPFLGTALITTLLGLWISIIALAYRQLLAQGWAQDCIDLLEPLAHALEQSPIDLTELQRSVDLQRSTSSPWSEAFARIRLRRSLSALLFGLTLICLGSEPIDRLLILDLQKNVSPVAGSRPITVADLPPAPEEPPPSKPVQVPEPQVKEPQVKLRISDLLDEHPFTQTVLQAGDKTRLAAFVRHLRERKIPRDPLGHSSRALQYREIREPIAGFVDFVQPPEARVRLNQIFPRVLARFHLVEMPDGRVEAPLIVHRTPGHDRGRPSVTDFQSFLIELRSRGFSEIGMLIGPEQLRTIMPPAQLAELESAAFSLWNDIAPAYSEGRPLAAWIVHESRTKIDHILKAHGGSEVQGEHGDFVAFNWKVGNDGKQDVADLVDVAMISAKSMASRLNAEKPTAPK